LSLQEQLDYIKENMPEAYEYLTEKVATDIPLPIFDDNDDLVGYQPAV
jgi:hypothetical protein